MPDTWQEVKPLNFPGMSAYCDCDGKFSTSCDTTKEKDANCKKFEAEKSRNMSLWKGKKLAFRRFKKKEIQYAKLNEKNVAFCEGGFKLCTNVHCVKDYVNCPINSFWLNERKASFVEETALVEKFELGEHELILERGKQNNRIINGFRMELNGMPCYNPASSHKLVSKNGSSVGSKFGGSGCTKPWLDNVEDYRSVDHKSLVEFLKQNGLREYIKGIPSSEMSHLLEETVHLTSRFKLFMALTRECQGFDIESINTFRIAIKTIFRIEMVVLGLSVLIFLYFWLRSSTSFGKRLMYLGVLNGGLNLASYLLVKVTHELANGFMNSVNDNIIPNKCLGESKLAKALFELTNKVHTTFVNQENITRGVFVACTVLVVVGFISGFFNQNKLSGENAIPKNIVKESQKPIGKGKK